MPIGLALLLALGGFSMVGVAFLNQAGWWPMADYPLRDAQHLRRILKDVTPEEFKPVTRGYTLNGPTGTAQVLAVRSIESPSALDVERIQTTWKDFAPTLVVTQGNIEWMAGSADRTRELMGAPGVVATLARQDNLPAYSLDAPMRAVYQRLATDYSAGEMVLFQSLRRYYSKQPVTQGDTDMEGILLEVSEAFGLESCPFPTIAGLDDFYGRALANNPDWRELKPIHLQPSYLLPADVQPSTLNSIAMAWEVYANEYAVAVISDAVHNGHRVFAVVSQDRATLQVAGLKHAPKHQPSFHIDPLH